jgi:hypothetical protein
MNNEIHKLLYHYNDEGQEGYALNEVQLIEKKMSKELEN